MKFQKLCVILLFATVCAGGSASATCSNASLKGVFGYLHGRAGADPATVTLGQLTLDGQGKITSGVWTETYSGTIYNGTATGKYAIAKNCTGTMTIVGEDDSTDHYNIYVNAGGNMFQMIENDADSNQPGFGLAQGTVKCGLSGTTVVLTTNLLGNTNGDLADTVGQVTLNGKGKISGNETFTLDGNITKSAVTGTYTESSTCTGTWQVTPKGGTALNFNTVVVNGGKEVLLIETDNDTITAGNAQE
jgi:hypothetical protein